MLCFVHQNISFSFCVRMKEVILERIQHLGRYLQSDFQWMPYLIKLSIFWLLWTCLAACLNIQDDLLIAANPICLARLAVVHSGFPPLWAGVLLFLSSVSNLCIAQKTVFVGIYWRKTAWGCLHAKERFLKTACLLRVSPNLQDGGKSEGRRWKESGGFVCMFFLTCPCLLFLRAMLINWCRISHSSPLGKWQCQLAHKILIKKNTETFRKSWDEHSARWCRLC